MSHSEHVNPIARALFGASATIASTVLLGFYGGETGIRTLGGLAPTTVFETAPFDHSGTSPRGSVRGGFSEERAGVQAENS